MMDERREKLKQHYGEIQDLAEARSTDLVCDLKEQFGQLKNQQEELKVQVDQALAVCVQQFMCVAALFGMLVTMVLNCVTMLC